MVERKHIVEGILEIALRVAESRGASKEDIALGIIAALRRIHGAVEEASSTLAAGMRAGIRDVILKRNLERLRETRATPKPAPLPERRASAALSAAILEDAANSCLAVNSVLPMNEGVEEAVRWLTERLIALLGGAPDYGCLVDRISGAADTPLSALAAARSPRPMLN